jgi:ankyrin repeat protein
MKRLFLAAVLVASSFCGMARAETDVAELNRQSLIAVRSGNLDKLRQLLEQGASVNTRNRFGDSLLMSAIKAGSTDTVRY